MSGQPPVAAPIAGEEIKIMSAEFETYLDRPIKEVMTEFPVLVDILNEYDIGCGACMVGTCLVKDIVSIHGLPPDREKELMARMESVITSPVQVELPPLPSARPKEPKEERTYSPPIKKLVDEHVLIKRLLALIPEVVLQLDLSSAEGRKLITDGVDFIRSYADRFHHGKEEEILFKYFDEKSEIIQAMHSDHETGRSHVRAIREALEKGDGQTVCTHLTAYRELLQEHINKENEILFPWMDRSLSAADKDALARQFATTEEAMGKDLPRHYEAIIAALEQKTK